MFQSMSAARVDESTRYRPGTALTKRSCSKKAGWWPIWSGDGLATTSPERDNRANSAGGVFAARRQFRLVACLLVCVFSVGSVSIAAERPNIVVIMTDDQRIDEATLAMPNVLDLIANEGVIFSNAIVHAPLCGPSRATFITGQYAHNHGVRANHRRFGYGALDASNTLPVWLQSAGYHTMFVGKYINEYGRDNPFAVPSGWSDWRGAFTNAYSQHFVNLNGTLMQYGSETADYRTDTLSRHAVAAIQSAPSDRPYFLWVATLAPHHQPCEGCPNLAVPAPRHRGAFTDLKPRTGLPAFASPAFNERGIGDKPRYIRQMKMLDKPGRQALAEKERARLESLMAVDDLVAAVADSVSTRGDMDNTVIMFTSDNGYLLGEHRAASGGKKLPYEESIRVPLLIRGPGFSPGLVDDRLISNQDLAPTIAALAGANAGLAMDGMDIREVPSTRAVYLFNQGDKGPPAYDGVRLEKGVLIQHETGEEELYDLRADPHQLRSCHNRSSCAQLRAELRQLLLSLRDCAGSSCRPMTEGAR